MKVWIVFNIFLLYRIVAFEIIVQYTTLYHHSEQLRSEKLEGKSFPVILNLSFIPFTLEKWNVSESLLFAYIVVYSLIHYIIIYFAISYNNNFEKYKLLHFQYVFVSVAKAMSSQVQSWTLFTCIITTDIVKYKYLY